MQSDVGGMLTIVNAEDASNDTALTQGFGRGGHTAHRMAFLLTEATCTKSDAFTASSATWFGCVPGRLLQVQIITWHFSKSRNVGSDLLSRTLMAKIE